MLWGGLAVAWLAGASPAGERPPFVRDADWMTSLAARRALWSDPALAELHLGVYVRGGEATLWGPVLTEQQSAEAVARLRLVAGVKSVVNELYVLPADDVLRQQFRPSADNPTRNPEPGVVAIPTPRPAVRAIPSDVQALVNEVRVADRRFESLRARVVGGVVTVTGSAARPADALLFAERVRSLPGVDRVVLRTDGAGP
jgi:hypothetical protein